jgi:hypothetical protein
MSNAARGDAMSRCRRVERYQGDLDDHYRGDKMTGLLSHLLYSAENES